MVRHSAFLCFMPFISYITTDMINVMTGQGGHWVADWIRSLHHDVNDFSSSENDQSIISCLMLGLFRDRFFSERGGRLEA